MLLDYSGLPPSPPHTQINFRTREASSTTTPNTTFPKKREYVTLIFYNHKYQLYHIRAAPYLMIIKEYTETSGSTIVKDQK